MSIETNPWQTLTSTTTYDNAWIKVTHHEVVTPGGNPGIYGTVHFKNLALAILPIDAEGYTWLVGQYRYPLGQYSWEIPEGGGDHGIDPLISAKRELREETGLEATTWQPILRMHLSNAVTDEAAIAYLATGLTQGTPQPEDTEQLQIRRVKFSEVCQMVERGEITDALSVATILRVQTMQGV